MATFKNEVHNDVTSVTTIYQAPASTTSIVYGMVVANTTGGVATIDVEVIDNSAALTAKLVKDLQIPAGNSFIPFSKTSKQVLEPSDSIRVLSDVAVDVYASILEDVSSNFKNAIKLNVTTDVEIYNAPSKTEIVQLNVANLSTTQQAVIKVVLTDDSAVVNVDIIKDLVVPIGSSWNTGDITNHLDLNDDISVVSDVGTDVIMSVLEGVN